MSVVIKNLTINQGEFKLHELNLEIRQGEYTMLMGKTGSGKSTILEIICGLRDIDHGEIWLEDQNITKYDPGHRKIGYVPQDGALFRHMTVYDNIAFPLKLRKWDHISVESRVLELATSLGIKHLLSRKAVNLSGGETQRIALARALSFKPSILCLDEPLSALDEDTKEDLVIILKNLQNQYSLTILHVSHSKWEAIRLANRIFTLTDGTLLEIPLKEI